MHKHFMMSFVNIDMTQVIESVPRVMQDKDLPIIYSQFHGCWCPGDARSQGIRNYDIYCVEPDNLVPAC